MTTAEREGLTLYQPMTASAVMASHKKDHNDLYDMRGIILQYMVSASLSMVGKELTTTLTIVGQQKLSKYIYSKHTWLPMPFVNSEASNYMVWFFVL